MRVRTSLVSLLVVVAGAAVFRMTLSVPHPVITGVTEAAEPASVVVAQAAPVPRAKVVPQLVPASPPAFVNEFDRGGSPQSGRAAKPVDPASDSLDPFGTIPTTTRIDMPPAIAEDTPVDAADVDPAPLRRELRALLDEKLGLLTVPQLQVAIDRTEREIREIRAQDRLQDLRHELDRLSRDYPHTWGGNAAQQLFNIPLVTPDAPGVHPFEAIRPQSDPLFHNPRGPNYTPAQPGRTFSPDAPSFQPASPTTSVPRKSS